MTYRYLLFYKPYNVLSQFTDTQATGDQMTGARMKGALVGDRANRQTLKDFIDVPGVYAVGRLDRDSEGLLLLTDDGAMQHRLSHPKFGHWRQYWVQVEHAATSPPVAEALSRLRQGVTIRGYRTRPAMAKEIAPPDLPPREPPIRYRKQVPTTWFEVMLSEGKNRQVRRMTAAVGFPTLRLVRSKLWLAENINSHDLESYDLEPNLEPHNLELTSRDLKRRPLTLGGLQPGEWRDLTPDEVRSLPRQAIAKRPIKKKVAKKTAQNPSPQKKSARTSAKTSAKRSTRRSSSRKSRTRKPRPK